MKSRLRLRITFRRRSELVLLPIAGLLMWVAAAHLASGQRDAIDVRSQALQSVGAEPGEPRQFYLTTGVHDGSSTTSACASGYHMASLWEILSPSNLSYNTVLGQTTDTDSGQGPPSSTNGWVRTGFINTVSGGAGMSNCGAWTNAGSRGWGTAVSLTSSWSTGGDLFVWDSTEAGCDREYAVWCVETVHLFADGFESGSTSAWSATVP